MNLFRVDFQHNMRPPMLIRGISRAQVSRQMKERYGDLFLRVDYISYEDAEAQFGHFDLFKNISIGENNKYKYNNNEDSTMQKDIKTVNEVSKKTLTNYMKGAERDKARKWGQRDMGKISSDDALHNQVKRNIGIDMAKSKIRPAKIKASEEVETNEGKAYGPTGVSYSVPKGHKDEVDPKTREKYPERQKPDFKAPKPIKEISKDTLSSYSRKASDQAGRTNVLSIKKQDNRIAGIKKAAVKMSNRNEAFANPAQQAVVMAKLKKSGDYKKPKNEEYAEFITPNSELTEEIYFKVNIQGLPDMYMTASSAGMIKAKLRKMLKNMDMIGDIVKTPKADVRKAFRMKAMEGEDSQDEATIIEVADKTSNNHDAKHVKQAIGIASDPRYKQGNMTGAVKVMNKLSPGLHKHPQVAAVLKRQNESKINEDLLSNKEKFSRPSDEVFEHDNSQEVDTTSINFTSILTGNNPFYKPIIEKQRLDPKCWDGYKKAGTKMKGDTRVNNCVKEEPSIDEISRNKIYNYLDKSGQEQGHRKDMESASSKRDKGFDMATKKVIGKAKVNATMEGQDEIQDKNADGLDDNQKPEGHKTAKQFPAPKDAKKKMKSLKMEMKSDIADLVIEKAKLKKNDIKMRAGKLDPKAMSALKTMNQDEAKVLVQGLPSNLRRSTMKELGIREVAVPSIVENLISKKL